MNKIIASNQLPCLFCKPPFAKLGVTENESSTKSLFSKHYPEVNGVISFRSLNLKSDLSLIHEWVHQAYAQEYWQMNGHFSQLYAIYQCMERNPFSHSFIGCFAPLAMTSLAPLAMTSPGTKVPPPQKGEMICQFDVYSVVADELKEHINFEPHDCGFHLLMAPNEKPVPGLTVTVIKSFLDYYFSFAEAKRMYAEPDVNNLKSIALLERSGFERIKTVEMSYKRAHVYVIERDSFNTE